MDQSATSDELNATTPDSEIIEDAIVPQKKDSDQAQSALESFSQNEVGTKCVLYVYILISFSIRILVHN